MTLSNETDEPAVDHHAWASPTRWGLLGLVVQAVAALVIWTVVDDSANRSWANRDLQEWATSSLLLGVLVAALGGAATRRWRTTLAVATGCLLAIALGGVVFIGYAVANSA